MAHDISLPDPSRFNLTTFAEILPTRDPILGEDPGSFDGFRAGMMQSLVPMTPYECTIAENLIAIEWELVQHRRMRDAGLSRHIRTAIRDAMSSFYRSLHEDEMDAAYEEFVAAGGADEDWKDPEKFDQGPAHEHADKLWEMCISTDQAGHAEAYAEIEALGREPVELMGEAYRSFDRTISFHDTKLPDLEKRRREVKRDYDLLQSARPIEAEVIEG